METIQSTYRTITLSHVEKKTLTGQFLNWCKGQEENRLLWLAIIIAIHGCVLTPLTAITIASTGNSMMFWAIAIAGMAAPLVTNLAALPTKVTIPVFFFSILMDISVIIFSVAGYFASSTV